MYPIGAGPRYSVNCANDFFIRARIKVGLLVIVALCGAIAGCGESEGSMPSEGPDVVVKRFYEYISEAKIKGGVTPLREAYKLISSDMSRVSEAKFLEITNKYPPGFMVEIVETETDGRQASVTIAYKMQSMFDEYTVKTVIPLSVDDATNTWKIDFTGELDGQEKPVANKEPQ